MTKYIFLAVVLVSVVAGSMMIKNDKQAEQVGDFVYNDVSYGLYKDQNKYNMTYVSLINQSSKRIHATTGWLPAEMDLKFDCQKPDDCLVIQKVDQDLKVITGFLLQEKALTGPLSKLQLDANRLFGFKDHSRGYSEQVTQEVIRTFPPSEDKPVTSSGLRS